MKAKNLLAVALVAVGLLVFAKINFIQDDCGGGGLLWKDDTAYMFMGDCKAGVRLSPLRYLMEPIMEYFYAPAATEHSKNALTVFRITPAGVERYVQEPYVEISDLTTVENEIYARCPGGICKWTGNRFALIPEEEEKQLFENGHLSRGEFANVNGWSKRGIQSTALYQKTGHYEFTVELSKQLSLLVKGSNPVFVEVLRSGQQPERIWYHEQRTRRVSKSEYEQVFGR